MGAPKQKWTSEEEDALRAGIEKHGPGKWRTIQTDPEFSGLLANRSNIDLKDKWRNLSVSACSLVGSGYRDKAVKSPKLKALPAPPAAVPAPIFSAPIDIRPLAISFPVKKQQEAPSSRPLAITFPVKKQQEGPSRYHALILEALSTLRDPNGTDISAIHHFIEQRQEVGPNFRKTLSSKLKDLLGKDKIEKVSNGYRLKDPSFITKTPTPRQMDSSFRTQPNRVVQTASSQSDYATKVAQIIAVADDKSRKADEAVQEAENVSRMAEENDSLLQHVKGLFEQCLHGEIIPIA